MPKTLYRRLGPNPTSSDPNKCKFVIIKKTNIEVNDQLTILNDVMINFGNCQIKLKRELPSGKRFPPPIVRIRFS